MRAIENGRYLVRAANTGISGIVDPYGRVIVASRIFEPAVIVGEARFLQTTTVYTRIGDVFAYASERRDAGAAGGVAVACTINGSGLHPARCGFTQPAHHSRDEGLRMATVDDLKTTLRRTQPPGCRSPGLSLRPLIPTRN